MHISVSRCSAISALAAWQVLMPPLCPDAHAWRKSKASPPRSSASRMRVGAMRSAARNSSVADTAAVLPSVGVPYNRCT
ncbi:Uncharacterised protein [Bordetella pertussis]|nr:Uncharacterised protein [Bordetella pertussis]